MRAKSIFLRLILISLLLFPLSPVNEAVAATPYISEIPDQTTNEDVPLGPISFTVNDPPTITDIPNQTIDEDSLAGTGALAFTIGDLETDAGSLTITGSSSNTTLVPNVNIVFGGSGANRTVTVTPLVNQFGTATITINVSDGISTAIDTFTLTVTSVNDPPTISNIADQSTGEDTSTNALSFTVNDIETPVASLTVSGSSSNTTLVPNNNLVNIVFGGSGANRTVTITPASNQIGETTITVSVTDSNSSTVSDTFVLNVTALNDAPTATNDNYSVDEGNLLTINLPGVLGNDTDPDVGNILTAAKDTDPSHGTLSLISDGSFTYTPTGNYTGPDSFTYHASDGTVSSNIATVSITVNPVNDNPTADNDSYSVDENAVLNVDAAAGVLIGDTDLDGDPLSAVKDTNPSHGTLTLNSDGSFTYTPADNYTGSDSFTYHASDSTASSNIATVSFTVNPVNDSPIADNDGYSVNEDNTLTVLAADGVLNGDTDVEGDSLSAVKDTNPAHGTVTLDSDGSFTYIPTGNYSGSDSFTYHAFDGTATSTSATVTITVNPFNDNPTADNEGYSVDENAVLNVDAATGVLNGDTDIDGDTLSAVKDSNPTHGTVTLNSDGSFTYTPAGDYNGSDSFTYHAYDGTGSSSIATVTITVNPVNDNPIADNESYSVDENFVLDVNAADGVLNGDTDIDGDTLTAAKVSDPAHGTLTLNSDGSFTYTPTADFTGSDSFTYHAYDGTAPSNDATVSITVNDVLPTIESNKSSTLALSTGSLETAAGSLTITGSSTNKDLVPDANIVFGGSGATRTVTITPAANKTGTTIITITVTNGSNGTASESFVLTVNPVNDAPTALDDPYSIRQGSTLNVSKTQGILANDKDIEGDPSQKGYDYLVVELIAGPEHAEEFNLLKEPDGEFRGAFTYRPEPHFAGSDSFTYRAKDSGGNVSLETTVEITVLDIESPLVSWTEPVTDGVTYDVVTGMVPLGVEAEDNVSIQRVRFLRWDALLNKHVEIGTDYEAPYEVELDANTLNWGWNQVFAEAYDNLGNRSNIPYIWLYRDKMPYFLPIISVPTR